MQQLASGGRLTRWSPLAPFSAVGTGPHGSGAHRQRYTRADPDKGEVEGVVGKGMTTSCCEHSRSRRCARFFRGRVAMGVFGPPRHKASLPGWPSSTTTASGVPRARHNTPLQRCLTVEVVPQNGCSGCPHARSIYGGIHISIALRTHLTVGDSTRSDTV